MAIGNIEIYIDAREAVRYAESVLGKLQGGKARQAVATAINKTAKEIKKLNEKAAKKTFTDKSDLNELEFEKATTANLEAFLRDRGGSVSMTHFKWRDGKTVISALINKNHGYKKLIFNGNKAWFNANLRNGGYTIVVREGKKRLPLQKVKSLSSPSAHGAPDVWDKETAQRGAELFYKNLEKELVRILNLI